MYRWTIVLTSLALLGGCGSVQKDAFMETSADLLARTGEALSRIGEKTPAQTDLPDPRPNPKQDELAALFDQPYIDPLTEYLRRHDDDARPASQLERVRRERDRRCRVIAENFEKDPKTRAQLARYRAGYSFSCPDQVASYQEALLADLEKKSNEPQDRPDSPDSPDPILNNQVSDCYLLTAIRNFSEALRACSGPAEAGDVQAQTNMALIFYALADYRNAYQWASEAAPASGEAAFLLANMYTNGQGVGPDPDQAEKWYHQAAGQGHAGAKAVLQEGTDSRGITKTQ